MKMRFIVPALVLAFAGTAYAAPAVETVKTEKGNVLAGEKGMTLYTFKNDKKGVSNCYDKCAVNWPPFFRSHGRQGRGSLFRRDAQGRQDAVGKGRHAALLLGQGHEKRRCHRRRYERCMGCRKTLMA